MRYNKLFSKNLLLGVLFLALTLLVLFVVTGLGQSEGSDVCDSPACARCTTINSDCTKCVKFDELDSHGITWYPHTIDGIQIKNPLFKTDSGTSPTCTINDPEEDECELIRFDWVSDSANTSASYSVPIDCLFIKTGWGPHHVHDPYDPDYYFEYDPDAYSGTNISPPDDDNSAISHITFCYDITANVSHNPSSFNITQSKLEDHLGEQYLPLGSLELSVTGDSVENADCKYQYDNNCLQSNALYLTEESILDPTNCTSSSVCGYLYLEGLNNQPTETLTDIPEGTYNTFIDLNKVADEGAPASCNITIKAEVDSCS